MPNSAVEELTRQLNQLFDFEISAEPTSDINAALRIADFLETKGYSFKLKDMCPKSMYDTQWQATFASAGTEFAAKDSQPAVAICIAAVAALESAAVF